MSDSAPHDRYQRLQLVRETWFQRTDRAQQDRRGVTIEIDGRECIDIPSFYLVLGQAVNGLNGYYGTCLDSLDDCLCGGFGLVPPFTLVVYGADKMRDNLGPVAVGQWYNMWDSGVESATGGTTSPLAKPPTSEHARNYMDQIIDILNAHNVTISLHSATT